MLRIASGPEQTDVMEFCLDEAVIMKSIRVFHSWMGGNIIRIDILGETSKAWTTVHNGKYDSFLNSGFQIVFKR